MFPLVYKSKKGSVAVDSSRVNQVSTFSTVLLNTTYQPIISFNSKGYLNTFMMPSNANAVSVRITVDGVVKFEGTGNNTPGVVGMVIKPLLHSTGGALTPAVQNPAGLAAFFAFSVANGFVGYPNTTNAALTSTLCVPPDSIYCKNSLLVEAKCTSTTVNLAYYVAGGSI